jgi:hypothetical protein
MTDTQTARTPAGRRQLLARTVRLPRLSGKASAAWLLFCFLLTALLIPALLRLPRWIDYEIVLAAWWAVWLAVLSRLLYTGQHVADDHRLAQPRNWFASNREEAQGGLTVAPAPDVAPGWLSMNKKEGQGKTASNDRDDAGHREDRAARASWWDGFFWGSVAGDEAVAVGCLVVIGLVLLVGVVWFLIEVAIPLVLFVLYFVTRGMLAHVVNDRHRCRSRLSRALAWAGIWATVYTVPLAGVVWLVHNVTSGRAAR